MNEAMLVLAGDLDEATVKRILLRYVGGFRTQKGAAPRKTLRYQPVPGVSTHTSADGPKGVYVRLDTEYALSGVNYVLSSVAAEVLRRHVVKALEGTGLSTDVTVGFHSYPQERLWMYIACEGDGAAAALPAVRQGIRNAASATISPKDLDAIKAMVQAETARELSETSTVVTSVVARYGIGKDLVSHYKESIGGITAARLSDMLSSLAAGSAVEYVIE